MRSNGRPIVTLILAAALVAVPTTALASHNSLGGHVNVVEPDEVHLGDDQVGTLDPDVPADLLPRFHEHLDVPREAPGDQSGLRYDPADGCNPATDYNDKGTYDSALRSGEACYVGYLDGQWEYVQFTQIFGVRRNADLLYPANPPSSNGYCNGEDPEQVTGVDPADEAIARLTRADDQECQGGGHAQYMPGFLLVDTDLLEAPTQGPEQNGDEQIAPGAADAAGNRQASGTITLPLMLSPYVYLFGQPHPDNPAPSPFEAGAGPFGPGPTAFGAPNADMAGACGERTEECRLLEPFDVIHYDPYADELIEGGDTLAGLGNQARVCQFTPTLFYEHPKPERRAPSLCGPQGRVVDDFYGELNQGGFGIDQAPPTWLATVPGWYRGVVFQTLGEAGAAAEVADEYVADPTPSSVENDPNLRDYEPYLTDDTDGQQDTAIPQVWAVNPRVPLPSDDLWCVQPNILATGDDGVLNVNDPGVYGTYQADAIDTDLYRAVLSSQYQTTLDLTHGALRPAIAVAEDTLPTTDAGQGGDLPVLPPAVEEVLRTGLDRADPTTSYSPDTPDTPMTFTKQRNAGLSCSANGHLSVLAEDTTLDGTLRFDARLIANSGNDDQIPHFPQPPGVLLKDPTDGGEPAPASSSSQPSPWAPDVYSFQGRVQAVLDANANDRFDRCARSGATGAADACLWQGLWDAYNPSCTDSQGTTCEGILDRLHYDTEAGVGLYFVLKLSGPVLVMDEDRSGSDTLRERTHLVGAADVTAQNCIVGTSTGFAAKLADSLGTTAPDLPEQLCGGADGERILIEDAFDDQTAVDKQLTNADERGFFSAAIQWVRPATLPDLVKQNTGMGETDELCLNAVFNVQPGETAADTADSLALTDSNTFTDCDAFGSQAS